MSSESNYSPGDKILFWGCFIALITTAFAFITRAFLINMDALWPSTFGLDAVQAQELFGAGLWPFAISIIVFSLVIDKIGYKTAMVFSFVCYALYAAMAFKAHGIVSGVEGEALKDAQKIAYSYLYGGSIILGLGNGTVEAFINPVVATMFHKEKTKWLNILHAGWPGGLVLGGFLTIYLGDRAAEDWRILIYLIAIPSLIFLIMLLKAKFPINERVASGTSYKEMLSEFGFIGALLASALIFGQMRKEFDWDPYLTSAIILVVAVIYGVYCQSFGRPLLIFLCIIMMPLATTELGTDAAITGIMEKPMTDSGKNPLWVLIYTSAIMAVLRFWFAGAIVKKLTPIGLLIASSALAILGLFFLSSAQGMAAIFVFATLYGFGKTFFWPTMLGIVSEQCPKGGALTLNAIAGIGMLTVGIIGNPLIGEMQENSAKKALPRDVYEQVLKSDKYILGKYTAVDMDKVDALDAEKAEEIKETIRVAKQGALKNVTIFPILMLISYILLALYFKSRGGYKSVSLSSKDDLEPVDQA